MFLELKLPNFPGEIQRGLATSITPLFLPLLALTPFPLVCRGEVSQDLLWAWLLVSPPGMLARMVPRGKSRTAEKQSLLVFVSLQKGVYGKMGAESLVYIPADG